MKWGGSFFRIVLLKIRYGNAFNLEKSLTNPIYIGKQCRIIINGTGSIALKQGVYLDDFSILEVNGGNIEIASNCYFNRFCKVIAKGRIVIGSGCMFGPNVAVYDHDHDISHGVRNGANRYITDSVFIGNNVWCCANVVVTKGSTIEKNCVIAANAVLINNTLPNSVYAGIPAKWKRNIDEG